MRRSSPNRRLSSVLLGAAALGCAHQPPAAPPAQEARVGYYGCTGTNDETLGANGFVELRADGTFDMEFAITTNGNTDASAREALVDELGRPIRSSGRWREREANVIELQTGWLLAARPDRTLELVGPCLSVAFAYARPPRDR